MKLKNMMTFSFTRQLISNQGHSHLHITYTIEPVMAWRFSMTYTLSVIWGLNDGDGRRCHHNKHETLTQCWFNVGPASQTAVQQWSNIGSMSRVCCNTAQCRPSKHKTFVYHLYNVGLTSKMLGRRCINVITCFLFAGGGGLTFSVVCA